MRLRKRWRLRYLNFVRVRFLKYSRGGGDWRPLAPATIAARRRGRKRGVPIRVNAARTGGSAAILRDTGTMFRALDIGDQSNAKPITHGVRVGFIGRQRAATINGKNVLTVAELASYHQNGGGRLPKRPMIVDPDRATLLGLIADARMAMGGAQ